jgi:hypothetical protein
VVQRRDTASPSTLAAIRATMQHKLSLQHSHGLRTSLARATKVQYASTGDTNRPFEAYGNRTTLQPLKAIDLYELTPSYKNFKDARL